MELFAAITSELRGNWQRPFKSKEDINVVRWGQLKRMLQSGKHNKVWKWYKGFITCMPSWFTFSLSDAFPSKRFIGCTSISIWSKIYFPFLFWKDYVELKKIFILPLIVVRAGAAQMCGRDCVLLYVPKAWYGGFIQLCLISFEQVSYTQLD